MAVTEHRPGSAASAAVAPTAAASVESSADAVRPVCTIYFRAPRPSHTVSEVRVAPAEHVSGQDLDELFTAWLYTPTRPS